MEIKYELKNKPSAFSSFLKYYLFHMAWKEFSPFKFSDVASCACCLHTPGDRAAYHQRVAYRRR
jgi:hypothetical protein